nr:SAP domain-containing protein [Deltaproteobacteria bacterium]
MRFHDIKRMAKNIGINPYRMDKIEVIQAIQRAEHSPDCYGTERVKECEDADCIWRMDCLSHNSRSVIG